MDVYFAYDNIYHYTACTHVSFMELWKPKWLILNLFRVVYDREKLKTDNTLGTNCLVLSVFWNLLKYTHPRTKWDEVSALSTWCPPFGLVVNLNNLNVKQYILFCHLILI